MFIGEPPFRGVERLRLELSMRARRGGFTAHVVHLYLRSIDSLLATFSRSVLCLVIFETWLGLSEP